MIDRAAALRGRLRLPSDKSVGHRALIFNALADAPATIVLRRPGADLWSTARCLRALGADVQADDQVDGAIPFRTGGDPFSSPNAPLDCRNSGTTLRLLTGALAGIPVEAVLDGDASLRSRPMERVAAPLRAMGAAVETSNGRPPLRVAGRARLEAREHRLEVASAQLIGAIALAALSATGTTSIESPGPTRDHTERLLARMGVPISRTERTGRPGDGVVTTIVGPTRPRPLSIEVPGDPSAAAAWLVAAAVHPDADLELVDVCLNETRLALVDALREMGAAVEVTVRDAAGPEVVGDVRVRSAGRLRAIRIDGPRAASLIDELPLLGVAMAAAEGTSELRDAGELRVKESDRVSATAAGLAAIGARVEELSDGWRVARGAPREARIATRHDHRVAIAFTVAALSGVAGTVCLDDAECVDVSYPGFWEDVALVNGTTTP